MSDTCVTIGKYAGWKLSKPKIARPQLNMEIATIEAKVWDAHEGKHLKKIILCISNNNCCIETVIPEEVWEAIK